MEQFNVYEGIREGLREALAYQNGDTSKGRASIRSTPAAHQPETAYSGWHVKCQAADPMPPTDLDSRRSQNYPGKDT